MPPNDKPTWTEMSKHVDDEENWTALSWGRQCYLKQAFGVRPNPCPVSEVARDRSETFLEGQYDDAESIIDSWLPTDRFDDDELWVLAAMKRHIIAEYPTAPTDGPGWHYTRSSLLRQVTDGEVKVLGGQPAPTQRGLKEATTRLLYKFRDSGFVQHKKGFTGVASMMEPLDTHALHSLPVIRPDQPILEVPRLSLPTTEEGTSSPPGGASGSEGNVVMVRTLLRAEQTFDFDRERAVKVAIKRLLDAREETYRDVGDGRSFEKNGLTLEATDRYVYYRDDEHLWSLQCAVRTEVDRVMSPENVRRREQAREAKVRRKLNRPMTLDEMRNFRA